jgi:prepilin-type N-terminal cleavage/methylation domain-containing protein
MLIFRVPISLKIKGFTLLELLIVVLLISIFLTFASVNWNITSTKDKDSILEDFSTGLLLIREEAIANYENKVIEFDITANKVNAGIVDNNGAFVNQNEIVFLQNYLMKDAIINGEPHPLGKCYMTLYSSGMADRAIIHLEGDIGYYSLIVNPLTSKVTGEKGYIEESQIGERNKSS